MRLTGRSRHFERCGYVGRSGANVRCTYPRSCYEAQSQSINCTPLETHRYTRENTHAVKSALPDAARDPSRLSFVLQTAPLCPTNVPIQSPVHSRNIGFPSLQLDMSRYVPSSNSGEKERCVIGRVCPGATSGTALGGADIAIRDLEKKEQEFGRVAR